MKVWLESSNFAGMTGKEIKVKFPVGGWGGGLYFLLQFKGVLSSILLARNWMTHLCNNPLLDIGGYIGNSHHL